MGTADPLHGVRVLELATRRDDRGAFTETFRQAWLPAGVPAMVQSNLSVSRVGVLRGMHFHRHQADYWCVLEGRAFVALFDLRVGSPSWGEAWSETFEASQGLCGLYGPAGVAHGFCALTEVRLQYMVDRSFADDDEQEFAWNDPDLLVDWPIHDPILSERDARAAPLAQVVIDPPTFVD